LRGIESWVEAFRWYVAAKKEPAESIASLFALPFSTILGRAECMATNRNFTNFRAVYDDLTDEVTRSRPQFLPDHLDNWFALMDETPGVRDIVRSIERSPGIEQYDFMNRLKVPKQVVPLPPLPGSRPPGPLQWPADREKRLGMQLKVFREIARRTLSVTDFGTQFIEGASAADAPKLAVEYVFSPMARELRRRLEAALADVDDAEIPASDRTVTVDHNSEAYGEAVTALEELEEAIRGANDFAEAEEKEQRIAEVSALRRVMQAVRIRIEPVVTLLKPIVVQFGTKLKDTVVGIAVNKVVGALSAVIGQVVKSLTGL
jgi:hypothetical protein